MFMVKFFNQQAIDLNDENLMGQYKENFKKYFEHR